MQKKLIVTGGGAAGFFGAVNAARLNPSLKAVLVEKTGKLLSKVKVSGGGRCNVTHACFDRELMSKHYPRGEKFVKKTFHQFFTADTIQWFEERGVKLKTEKDGRMFPVSDSSQSIIDCLLKEAARYNVEIMMHTEVQELKPGPGGFELRMTGGRQLYADYVIAACGGYPKSSMFNWLLQSGHSIEEPVPSLFTFNLPGHAITKLMGVSVEKARVKISGKKFEQEGPLLITHWGLSGPAVLKLSAFGARELALSNWNFIIYINWVPDFNEQQLAEKFRSLRFELAAQHISNKNPFSLPHRLWDFLISSAAVSAERRWADLTAKEQTSIIKNLSFYQCEVKGKTTFKEEFVTAGGIKLSEVDHTTMMSKKVPGLFFAGEILDVDGITGGFNFQHAWTSGYIAGASVAAAAKL